MNSRMMFSYIFVDESGDLGKLGSKYFTIACLSTTDTKPIERIIKKVRQRKLKKKMKEVSELKANSSSPRIREDVLKRVSKCNCEIGLIVIDKEKVREYLYNAKNKLYNYVFGLLLKEIDLDKTTIEIIIDKKDSNRLLREDLDQYILNKIKETNPHSKIKIKHLESHAHKALQVIDFVAWATNRKYSFDDDSYYKIIEPKVKVLIKLWK